MAKINRIRIGDEIYDIIPEIGKGLEFGTNPPNLNKIYVTLGTAKAGANGSTDTGICVKEGEFTIDTGKFTAFLNGLGFKNE